MFDTHAVNPVLIPNIPFDTVKDLAPVMMIVRSPMVITAHYLAPYKSFADMIGASNEKPESVSFGTIASGSLAHLAMTQISNQLGVTMNHVPYKGGGPLIIDAIAGHVPVAIASMALLCPHIKTGKLVPLAVTSPKRSTQLPDTPTVAELALPGYDAEAWWGMLAPARTPRDIIERVRESMTKALNDDTSGVRLKSRDSFTICPAAKRWAALSRAKLQNGARLSETTISMQGSSNRSASRGSMQKLRIAFSGARSERNRPCEQLRCSWN